MSHETHVIAASSSYRRAHAPAFGLEGVDAILVDGRGRRACPGLPPLLALAVGLRRRARQPDWVSGVEGPVVSAP